MIILYFCFIGFPLAILIQNIRHGDFSDPKLYVWIIIWIVACTVFWTYMDWWTWDSGPPLNDKDWYRK